VRKILLLKVLQYSPRRPFDQGLHDPAKYHDTGKSQRGERHEPRSRYFKRGDRGAEHLHCVGVVIEFLRQRSDGGTVLRVPAVPNVSVLIGPAA